jgi:predicted metalloendopeptidase
MKCFVDEFSSYEIFPGLNVNGKLSAGENMADVAGLRVAFRAHQKRRAGSSTRVVADGLDEDQQFFLARAQAWCTLITDEAARSSNEENPHIHPRWAVNGPLLHLREFHQAFGCQPPGRVCSMW